MFLCIIYTNYDWKLTVKKSEIPWYEFRELALSRSYKIFQEDKRRENEVLVCIYFKIRELV